MRTILLITATLLFPMASPSIEPSDDPGLPSLHQIRRTTLSPSYSCRSKEEFHRGYEQTALFLSRYAVRRESPELVFHGSCGAEDYFQGYTAGDDMSVIADLGKIRLEALSANLVFNPTNARSFDVDSKFVQRTTVQNGHTYALLINRHDRRGLLVFTVVGYVPNRSVELRYAVKEYQLLKRSAESEGFDWNAQNHLDGDAAPPEQDCDAQPEE